MRKSALQGEAMTRLLNKQNITNQEYKHIYTECKKIATRALKSYKCQTFVFKPNIFEEAVEDVACVSLTKALAQYKPGKGAAFSTYLVSKARSCARVQAGKLARRTKLINAYSWEAFHEKGNE